MVVFRASSSKGKSGKPSSGNEDDRTDFDDALLQEHPRRKTTPQWGGGEIFCTIFFFFELYSLGYHVKEEEDFSFSFFFCLTFLLSPSFLDDTE